MIVYILMLIIYRNDRNDREACANNADPDQTAPRGAVLSRSSLFAFLVASFRKLPCELALLLEFYSVNSKLLWCRKI